MHICNRLILLLKGREKEIPNSMPHLNSSYTSDSDSIRTLLDSAVCYEYTHIIEQHSEYRLLFIQSDEILIRVRRANSGSRTSLIVENLSSKSFQIKFSQWQLLANSSENLLASKKHCYLCFWSLFLLLKFLFDRRTHNRITRRAYPDKSCRTLLLHLPPCVLLKTDASRTREHREICA